MVSSLLHSRASPASLVAPLWLWWLSIMAATFCSSLHTCSRYFLRICRYELSALLQGSPTRPGLAERQSHKFNVFSIIITCVPVWGEQYAPHCPSCVRGCLWVLCLRSHGPEPVSSLGLVLWENEIIVQKEPLKSYFWLSRRGCLLKRFCGKCEKVCIHPLSLTSEHIWWITWERSDSRKKNNIQG